MAEIHPSYEYTSWELNELADELLREDARNERPIGEYPAILFNEHLYHRRKREILSTSGVVDEALTNELSPDGQRMFHRTHPEGRKVNSPEQRKRGSSFYK